MSFHAEAVPMHVAALATKDELQELRTALSGRYRLIEQGEVLVIPHHLSDLAVALLAPAIEEALQHVAARNLPQLAFPRCDEDGGVMMDGSASEIAVAEMLGAHGGGVMQIQPMEFSDEPTEKQVKAEALNKPDPFDTH